MSASSYVKLAIEKEILTVAMENKSKHENSEIQRIGKSLRASEQKGLLEMIKKGTWVANVGLHGREAAQNPQPVGLGVSLKVNDVYNQGWHKKRIKVTDRRSIHIQE